MGRGEEVGARGHQQDIGALDVDRKSHGNAGFFLDLLPEAFQRRLQGLGRQAEVVADAEDLADDLVGIFLPHADRVHDVARGHGDFGGVDAIGAEHRTAAALGALMEIGIPVVEHVLGEILGADQLREQFSREGEMAAIDLAQQVLARDRHVLGVRRAEEIMALVGAGAAFDAGIEVNPQRLVAVEQFAEALNSLVVPVGNQFARESQRSLMIGRRDIGFRPRHRPAGQMGHFDRVAVNLFTRIEIAGRLCHVNKPQARRGVDSSLALRA